MAPFFILLCEVYTMAQTIRLTKEKSATHKSKTQDALLRELDYWCSRKILADMLREGLISPDEYRKIDALNRQSFCPALAQLMV
jgi:hypothetical protein